MNGNFLTSSATPASNEMRVLLIEDDSRISDFVRRGLKAEGFTVEVADDGRTGINLAINGTFQVIVLDLLLPDMNGREVCEQLRGSGVKIPILMLTAMDTLFDKVSGLRSGADDYMTKPFAFEELLARIEVLMRRGDNVVKPKVNQMRVADLVLNVETYEVKRGQVPIDLTPKEFALLEYLMRMQGKVVSRTRIIEQVWGYDADPLTNIVDVFIRQIRRKIDDDFEPKLLKTVRGFGYKIEL